MLPPPSALPVLAAGGTTIPVDQLCVSVQVTDKTEAVSVTATVLALLQRSHIQVTNQGAPCKANLLVEMTYTWLGAWYVPTKESSSVEKCYVFSGRMMDGRVKLDIAGAAPIVVSLHDEVDPYQYLDSCTSTPPVNLVWTSGLLDAATQIWGPLVLVGALGVDAVGDLALNRLQNIGGGIPSPTNEQLISDMIPELTRTLRDSDPTARERAAKVIGTFAAQASATIPDLIALLDDSSIGIRTAAASALGGIGPQAAAAVPALVDLTQVHDARAPDAAIHALGEIGPTAASAVPTLKALLDDPNLGFQRQVAVVTSLGQIGPAAAETVPELTNLLKGGTAPVLSSDDATTLRVQAAIALMRMNVDIRSALSDILALAGSADPQTQWEIIYAMALMAPSVPEVIPYLIRVVDGASVYSSIARGFVIRELGLCGPTASDAISALRRVTTDPSARELRAHAYVALVKIGDMTAADALTKVIPLLSSSDILVQQSAVLALGDLGPEVATTAVPLLIKALRDQEGAAIAALGQMGSSAASAVPQLIAIVPSESAEGDYAVVALGKIGPAALKAVPAIINKLKNEANEKNRTDEVDALRKITGRDFGANPGQWQAWWASR